MGVQVNARRRGWVILTCAGILILVGVSAATLDKDAVNTAADVYTVTPTSVTEAPGSPYSITSPGNIVVQPL